jgi:hypothetical protein
MIRPASDGYVAPSIAPPAHPRFPCSRRKMPKADGSSRSEGARTGNAQRSRRPFDNLKANDPRYAKRRFPRFTGEDAEGRRGPTQRKPLTAPPKLSSSTPPSPSRVRRNPLPPFHGGRCRRQTGANAAKAPDCTPPHVVLAAALLPEQHRASHTPARQNEVTTPHPTPSTPGQHAIKATNPTPHRTIAAPHLGICHSSFRQPPRYPRPDVQGARRREATATIHTTLRLTTSRETP